MSSLALMLSLACACAWSAFDVSRKKLHASSPTSIVVLLMIGHLPFFGAWAVLAGAGIPERGYWLTAVASVLLNCLANVLFIRSVRISPLSRTVPLLSLTPALSAAVALPLLGESPSAPQLAGVLLVVLGALVLNADRTAGGGIAGFLRSLVAERGAVLMAVVALLWSASSVLDKAALAHARAPFHGLFVTAGVGLVLALVLTLGGQAAELAPRRGERAWLLLAVLFGSTAFGVQMLAYLETQVAFVEAVKRAVGVAAALVLGRTVFAEALTAWKLAAAGFMIAGILLLL